MKPLLEAIGVNFTYPGATAPALQDLHLRIPQGKKTAICGHNGSGKSTFFLHAIGIHRPASGQLIWKGADISYQPKHLKRLRREIGLVFQDPEHQLILNTPREDISYGLRNAGMSDPEIIRRTERMIASMGLEHLTETPIHQLSLGQKKRVALAGVLALEPELLILDEPTAYLDRSSEKQLVWELDRIHRQGVTVVMATHDMNLAYAWADWILVMDRGQCVMEGSPQAVFQDDSLLRTLGMELPLLLEVWLALPAMMQRRASAPRSIDEFRSIMSSFAPSVNFHNRYQ
ncbi:energy-coupling factor ABC transporter ATP-binding protein [Ferviditalea candida]|uniref:ABC transporter ATP-binding protein n=1 Tax=Ferviditalea candida TaxID=3108399 RepID=A0ABU5ZKW7_9BACL|nr:ABC transporter ATP-binding protein [Paenibacillaceae bacterium T2]